MMPHLDPQHSSNVVRQQTIENDQTASKTNAGIQKYQISNMSTPLGNQIRTIRVMAPADLYEGYYLDVKIDDRIVTVTVPQGGVKEGHYFTAPLTRSTDGEHKNITMVRRRRLSLSDYEPMVGQFKDGIFDCFRDITLFHPMLWNAMFCPAVALGQIMTRLRLTWLGHPEAETKADDGGSMSSFSTDTQSSQTFKRVIIITVIFILVEESLDWIMEGQLTYNTSSSDGNKVARIEISNPLIY